MAISIVKIAMFIKHMQLLHITHRHLAPAMPFCEIISCMICMKRCSTALIQFIVQLDEVKADKGLLVVFRMDRSWKHEATGNCVLNMVLLHLSDTFTPLGDYWKVKYWIETFGIYISNYNAKQLLTTQT